MRELSYLLTRPPVPSPIDAHHVCGPPGYEAPLPHRLDYFQALLLTDGRADVAVDGRRFRAQPGRVVLAAPGQSLAIDVSPGAGRHLLCFTAQAGAAQSSGLLRDEGVFGAVRSPLFVDLAPAEQRRIESALQAMADELDGWDEYSQDILEALLQETLGRLNRAARSGGAPQTEHRTSPWANRLLRSIELHFRSTRRVEDYARRLAVSPGHLHTLVRREFGCSPKRLIDTRVGREAQRLLRLTELTVGEIAAQLGFDDPSYFCRFFRRLTGTSPTTFRRRDAPPADR